MDMTQCTAKSKQSGQQCKRHAAAGHSVCRIHGGKSLSGIASPRLSSGRYSRVLPARLASRYQEALSDGALLELREEISLIDARLSDLISRVESGESGEVWQLLHTAYRDFSTARSVGKVAEMTQALNEIERLIVRGATDSSAWQEISSTIDQRRKLVESERRRLVEMQQMITTEQAMILMAAIVDTVRRHVPDKGALAAISADITRLITIEPRT
jgi:hypothetical protein